MPKRDSRPQLAQPAQQYSGGSVKYQLIGWGVLRGIRRNSGGSVFWGYPKPLGELVGLYYCVGPNRPEESGCDVLLGFSVASWGDGMDESRDSMQCWDPKGMG